MKRKKKLQTFTIDEEVSEFLAPYSKKYLASDFVNDAIRDTKQFKQWDEKREEKND